ncbi:MAG: hypothetical protein ACR2QO_20345 [Acidimicrobiales bacterium]
MTSTTGPYNGIRSGPRHLGRVLLVTVGGGDDWKILRSHLMGSGWMATPMEMDDITEKGGPGIETPRLDGIELAIFVVGDYESDESNVLATRSLLHFAGFLQGRLGYRRVLVLVEDRVDAFLRGTGVPEVPYTAGNIQDRFPQIAATLRDLETNPPQGRIRSGFERWMERMGLQHAEVASEVWLWAGGLVIGALVLTVAYLIFADPLRPESTAAPQATVVESGGDVGTTAGTVSGDAGGQAGAVDNDGVAGPVDAEASPVIPPINEGSLPGGATGRVESLPARCTVSTTDGEVTPSLITCDDNGGLVATGFLGPWDQEISAVTLSPGVVGEVHLASLPDDTAQTRVQLTPGQRVELEPYGSLSGTEQLVLEFSANNETVILHQSASRGGAELVLTFSLDM